MDGSHKLLYAMLRLAPTVKEITCLR